MPQRTANAVERACSKCGEVKDHSQYGTTRTIAGRAIKRAQCRDCYNVRRRSHYSRPDVLAEKRAKRSVYEQRPEVRARVAALRARPEARERERQAVRAYRARPGKKESIRARQREYLLSLHGRSVALLNSAAIRARKKRLPFELDLSWVQERLAKNTCALTGIQFKLNSAGRNRCKNPLAPSIDQIHAGQGYTKDNSRIVLASVNNALGQWGDEHLVCIAEALLRARGWALDPPDKETASALVTEEHTIHAV